MRKIRILAGSQGVKDVKWKSAYRDKPRNVDPRVLTVEAVSLHDRFLFWCRYDCHAQKHFTDYLYDPETDEYSAIGVAFVGKEELFIIISDRVMSYQEKSAWDKWLRKLVS